VNSGLPIFSIGEDAEKISMNDSLKINIKTGQIQNLKTGDEFQAKPFPDFVMAILEAGGIGPYILSRKSEYKFLK
jgi:3-isopropylmalate/(R)-2-methylmalate dehydratase small subunit